MKPSGLLGPNGLPINTIQKVTEYPIIPASDFPLLVAELQSILDAGQPAEMPWGIPGNVLLSLVSSLVHYAKLAQAVPLVVPAENETQDIEAQDEVAEE